MDGGGFKVEKDEREVGRIEAGLRRKRKGSTRLSDKFEERSDISIEPENRRPKKPQFHQRHRDNGELGRRRWRFGVL